MRTGNWCRRAALFICGVLFLLAVLLVLPGLFRIHPLIVKSGSMEPLYPVGSLIYVREEDTEALAEGEVVTFSLPEGEMLVTHRIVRIDREGELVYTKGDANPGEDGLATPFSRIMGSPVLCIPFLGYAAGCLGSPSGKAGILAAVILVFILSWMDDAFHRSEEAGEETGK